MTSFCSRCGYLLTGTADLLKTGGALATPPAAKHWWSARSRGIRKGIFIFLLMFLLAPLVGLVSTFGLGIEPWPVGIVVALCGVGGVLRIIYALLFESSAPVALEGTGSNAGMAGPSTGFATSALPPQRDIPASEYVSPTGGNWREPETAVPASVTDNTTKLLERDSD